MDAVANLALIPRACDALDIPVIAAVGIADRRGLASGPRKPIRCWSGEASKTPSAFCVRKRRGGCWTWKTAGPVEDLLPYIGGDAYARVVERGDLAAGVLSCGQGVGLINEILPAGKVIQRMVEEAGVVLGRLNALFP